MSELKSSQSSNDGASRLRTPSRAGLAKRVREAALGVDGVVAVGSASALQVATYGLPGEKVAGVRVMEIDDHLELEVHVVVRTVPLVPLAERVRLAIRESVIEWDTAPCVNIYIDELEDTL